MEDIKLKKLLSDLEDEASDEFGQLLSVGGKYYSTADLLYLKGRWRERYQTFLMLHRLLMYVAASSPILLLSGTALAFLKVHYLAFTLIVLAPVAFLAFLLGSYFLKREYDSKGHLEYLGLILEEEINERTNKRHIKR